ncbi:hypothetical protein K8I85_19585, partial [bacterium]|nr:hypothetical protein [bacterium]
MHAHLRPYARTLGTALTLLAALGGTALAGGTVDDYTTHPGFPDVANDPTVSDIDQAGDTIILAGVGGVRFTMFPVDGPPDVRGHVALDATAITVAGDHCVWVATSNEKLHRIDFSDVDNPVIDTTIDMNLGLVSDMTYHAASGKILARSNLGLIEITVPLDCGPGVPVPNLFVSSTNARGLAGDGTHVVAAIGSILFTLDPTSNPTSTIGTGLADGNVNSLSVQDDVVAAVTAAGTFSLVDRVALNVVYSTPAPADGRVRQSPDLAILLDPAKRMVYLFETTLPPGTMRNCSIATAGSPRAARVDDSRIVVATDEKVMYGRLGDRRSPAVLDQENPFIPSATWRNDMEKTLAVAAQNAVILYDISNPANPDSLGKYEPGTSLAGQDVEGYERLQRSGSAGQYLLVGSLAGFHVLDITDPANPALAGSIDGASSCVAVAPDGSRAARSDIQRNVHLVDLTDPATPTDRGSFQLANGVEDLVLDGTWLVAASIGETGRWDVTDPDAPVLDHAVPLTGIRALAKSATPDHFYLGATGTDGRITRYD